MFRSIAMEPKVKFVFRMTAMLCSLHKTVLTKLHICSKIVSTDVQCSRLSPHKFTVRHISTVGNWELNSRPTRIWQISMA
jgi:hypothetical protein